MGLRGWKDAADGSIGLIKNQNQNQNKNENENPARDQAMRAAQSACMNIAEAAGRFGGPDKARIFAIARGEACEVAAARHCGKVEAMRTARCFRRKRCRAAASCASHRAQTTVALKRR
jgi:four helix bundle protein